MLCNLNRAEFRDKVLGCWTGKNIGGTLGGPFEGWQEVPEIDFYATGNHGEPLPNDDLDLQLVWLTALEEQGVYRLTPRLLGEYWLSSVAASWNEYGVCKANIANGLYPPLSGAYNNETWKYSNGAWIRSEIWACLFPGDPDEAIRFAWMDACADHIGEGIFAEMFTAALESAAFVISDVEELLHIGLAKIPPDCRITAMVSLVRDARQAGKTWREAREAVVAANRDLGWFQAPGNIGFMVIGLLYGEGDFGRSLCLAVNCGDDCDCTAATLGSILGIIHGRSGIPARWIEPIGEHIVTCAITPFTLAVPRTVSELSDRVVRLAEQARAENPALTPLSEAATVWGEAAKTALAETGAARLIWQASSRELIFDLPFGTFSVEYLDGPIVEPGKPFRLRLVLKRTWQLEAQLQVSVRLPEGWSAAPMALQLMSKKEWSRGAANTVTVIPGGFSGAYAYLPLELRLLDRGNPTVVMVPLQCQGAVDYETVALYCGSADARLLARRGQDAGIVQHSDLNL